MKVLVTGALGYIGSKILDRLTKTEIKVIAMDNSPTWNSDINRWKDKIDFIHEDICCMSMPKDIDVIVHLAAEVGYVACDSKPKLAIQTNVEGTKKIASFGKPILFFSTGSVYGNLDDICTESSPCNPGSLYAKTKLEGEKYVHNIPHCIVRPATAFGISQKTRDDLLPHTLIQLALSGNVKIYQPDAIRTIYHVERIADFVLYCLMNWNEFENQTLNLGCSSGTLTKRDMLEKIMKYYKCSVEYVEGNDPDFRDYFVDYSKLHSLWNNEQLEFSNYILKILNYYKTKNASSPSKN